MGKWLTMCEYDSTLKHSDCLFDQLPDFKVVDIKTDRVVFAPQRCKYLALSYVWGDVRPYRLKADDFLSSEDRSYAQLDRRLLPHTIQDAILVAEALGAQYLWVDCLCILQDDSKEMKTMIHSMHQIFQAASLTIIAADSRSADSGIPGVSPGTRNIQCLSLSIENVNLVESEPELDLSKTIWASRGWTYQEHYFSTRALIFVHQLYEL
jgi:hypothetical protein